MRHMYDGGTRCCLEQYICIYIDGISKEKYFGCRLIGNNNQASKACESSSLGNDSSASGKVRPPSGRIHEDPPPTLPCPKQNLRLILRQTANLSRRLTRLNTKYQQVP